MTGSSLLRALRRPETLRDKPFTVKTTTDAGYLVSRRPETLRDNLCAGPSDGHLSGSGSGRFSTLPSFSSDRVGRG